MNNTLFKTLKVSHCDKDRVWCWCVYHDDTNKPNMSISLLDKYYGKYICWACGARGRLTTKQMESLNMSKKKRRKTPIPIDWNKLSQIYFGQCNEPLWFALQEKWGVLEDSLVLFTCGWDGEAYTFPMYNSDEQTIGIQRVWADGTKKAVNGSQLGLFIPASNKYYGTLYITEGISDSVCVLDLCLNVIGLPCATFGHELLLKHVSKEPYTNVVIVSDNDTAGQKCSNKLYDMISPIVDTNIFTPKETKDIRDLIKLKGKDYVREILNDYV